MSIISTAKKYIGTPYVWGGTTPNGFDCSGFTQYVFKQHAIALPRTTYQQVNVGSYVPRNNLKQNDLVFFNTTGANTHMGIYIGLGSFIHASSSKGVTISNLNEAYYNKAYSTARRVTVSDSMAEINAGEDVSSSDNLKMLTTYMARGFVYLIILAIIIIAVYNIYMKGA
jgi:hypothetical protein